jgi:hypothetical protein
MARGFVEPTIQPSYCRSQDIWCEAPDRATLGDGNRETHTLKGEMPGRPH